MIAPAQLDQLVAAMVDVYEDGAPAVLRQVGPLVTEAQLFAWISQAHPRAEGQRSRTKIRALKQDWGVTAGPLHGEASEDSGPGRPAELYRNGALLLDPAPFLPQPGTDFSTWVGETRAALGGAFGMQAPGIECASFEALALLQTLVAPILARTGPRSYRFNAFLGDYRRTPFGFHLDPHQEAVFQFVVHGRRSVRFWEGLTLHDDDGPWIEDSNDRVPPPRDPDFCADLEPGDLVFWPGTQVHGAEPEGPSLALSIVIERASPRSRAEVVRGLEVATMGGHAARPAVNAQASLDLSGPLRRRAVFPIAYERHDDTLVVGVCGRTFEWPDRGSIAAAMALFDRLNTGEPATAEALIASCASEDLGPEEIVEVLGLLTAWGFF